MILGATLAVAASLTIGNPNGDRAKVDDPVKKSDVVFRTLTSEAELKKLEQDAKPLELTGPTVRSGQSLHLFFYTYPSKQFGWWLDREQSKQLDAFQVPDSLKDRDGKQIPNPGHVATSTTQGPPGAEQPWRYVLIANPLNEPKEVQLVFRFQKLRQPRGPIIRVKLKVTP
jgi:hypothetical protein